MPTIPPLSPKAKAYAAAVVTFVVTVLAAVSPILDGTAAAVVTITLSVAASYGLVYATPNKNDPRHVAGNVTTAVEGVATAAGELLTPPKNEPPAPTS
jgi:hypothetical protein